MISALRRHISYANVAATLALVVAAGGYAFAQGQRKESKVRACVSKSSGTVRIVRSARCRKSERKIAWNKRGLRGLRGPTGATGPKGDPGDPAAFPRSEPFHNVGGGGEPQFSAGWGANGDQPTPRFYKDPLGVVHLDGGALGTGSTGVIFTLPPGYQPDTPQSITAGSLCGGGRHFVAPNGDVQAGTPNNVCVLDGGTFRAAD